MVFFTMILTTTAESYANSGQFAVHPTSATVIIANEYVNNASGKCVWGRIDTNGTLVLFYGGGYGIPSGKEIAVQGFFKTA